MFIRRARTRTTARGEIYDSDRLVRSERHRERVRQRTLLNLGSEFPIVREHWPLLCAGMERRLPGQDEWMPLPCPPQVEQEAQRLAAPRLHPARPTATEPPARPTVEVDPLEWIRPRSVGVEAVGRWAAEPLGLEDMLEELGFHGVQRALALASMIGRMAGPGSARATWRWLCQRSALGELLEVDFERRSAMRRYRLSDALWANRQAIERHRFDRVTDLFGRSDPVTLYDLTNTYFEGEATALPKARRGRSKEKRTDCPWLTLGLVLDGSGFVRRSEGFSGSVSEETTLASMLDPLHAPADALVVMEAGVATEANVTWLRNQRYRYLVVSRERTRRFDPDLAVALETRSRQTVEVPKVDEDESGDPRLYCDSKARAQKEQGIVEHFSTRLENELQQLHEG